MWKVVRINANINEMITSILPNEGKKWNMFVVYRLQNEDTFFEHSRKESYKNNMWKAVGIDAIINEKITSILPHVVVAYRLKNCDTSFQNSRTFSMISFGSSVCWFACCLFFSKTNCVEAIDFGKKSSKSEQCLRFFGCLKIFLCHSGGEGFELLACRLCWSNPKFSGHLKIANPDFSDFGVSFLHSEQNSS